MLNEYACETLLLTVTVNGVPPAEGTTLAELAVHVGGGLVPLVPLPDPQLIVIELP